MFLVVSPFRLRVSHHLDHAAQLGGLGALENAAGIDARLAVGVGYIGPIAHQATAGGKLSNFVDVGTA